MAVEDKKLAVVIPAFKAGGTIASVVEAIPSFVDWIIIVDDASPDQQEKVIRSLEDPRIILLAHEKNKGVGGAMVTGYKKALDLGADLIAKIDADGQMDPEYLDRFARVAILHGCDYVKANRFGHLDALPAMPLARLLGSLILTFLTKIASGYWNVFDPQNGYVMITRDMLCRLDLKRLDQDWFFENAMLINLNILRARIGEIFLPARYGDEGSTMKLSGIISTFPGKLLSGFLFRVYQKYIFRSVSPFFLLVVFGALTIGWGTIWGSFAWYRSIATGVPATTGTVILALLPLLLGFASVLQAFVFDVQDAGPCLLFDYDDQSLKGGQ